MAIQARCRGCGRSYSFKENKAGAKIRCQSCGAGFRVPDASPRSGSRGKSKVNPILVAGGVVLFLIVLGCFGIVGVVKRIVKSFGGDRNFAIKPDSAPNVSPRPPRIPVEPESNVAEHVAQPEPVVDTNFDVDPDVVYVPDTVEFEPLKGLRNVSLSTRTRDQEKVASLAVSPSGALAVICYHNGGNGGGCRLEVGNPQAGTISPGPNVAEKLLLTDISPDGTTLISRTIGFRTGGNGDVGLWTISSDGSLKREGRFAPFAEREGARHDVHWAKWVDASHIAVMSGGGEFLVWSIPQEKSVYSIQCPSPSSPALSPNRKHVALFRGEVTAIHDTLTGELLHTLPLPTDASVKFSFSPDGKWLAASDRFQAQVWNLTSSELKWKWPNPGGLPEFDWLSPQYVMVNRKLVIDNETELVVWQYQMTADASVVAGGQLWYAASSVSEVNLHSSTLPHAEAVRQSARNTSFAVRPGADVQIDIQANMLSEVEQKTLNDNMRMQLEAAGYVVVPSSRTKFVARLETGKQITETFELKSSFSRPFEITFTVRTYFRELVVNGAAVWSTSYSTGPWSEFIFPKDQEPQEFVDKQSAPRAASFYKGSKLPTWVTTDGKTGEEKSTSFGFGGLDFALVQQANLRHTPRPGESEVDWAIREIASNNIQAIPEALQALIDAEYDPKRVEQVSSLLCSNFSRALFPLEKMAPAMAKWRTNETDATIISKGQWYLKSDPELIMKLLADIGSEDCVAALVTCLEADTGDVVCVPFLISVGQKAEEPLLKYNRHADPEVRKQVYQVLAKVGTKRCLSTLKANSRLEMDPEMRQMVLDAIQAVSSRIN
ncbi:MAG: HEAT repeat domain-containing protein [Planctomycetaceae bacterium]